MADLKLRPQERFFFLFFTKDLLILAITVRLHLSFIQIVVIQLIWLSIPEVDTI